MTITIGFTVTIVLAIVRKHLFWWPIHPLGYGVSFHMHMFWAAFLISGILKGTILKFGGIRAYRRYVPFSLRLILGDLCNWKHLEYPVHYSEQANLYLLLLDLIVIGNCSTKT